MSPQRWVLLVLFAIGIGLVEATFVTLLPSPWREIRPVLEVSVLLVVVNKPKAALVFAGIAGLMLDVFRVDGPTFVFGRLIIVTSVVSLLAHALLTNRSVYATAALVIFARVFDRVLAGIHAFFGNIFLESGIRVDSIRSFFTTVAWDIALLSACFVLLAMFTRRFLVTVPRTTRDYDEP